MKFFKKIYNLIGSYKKRFFTVNQTELTGVSKLLMILFFFTSLWLIAQGIQSSTTQASTPQQKYGYECEQFVINNKLFIDDFKKIDDNYVGMYSGFGDAKECKEIEKKYKEITSNHHIQSEIDQISILQNKYNDTNFQVRRLNKEYSNMLLEKISNQDDNKSILHSNANKVKLEHDKLLKQAKEIEDTILKKSDIMNYPLIQDFTLLVGKSSQSIRDGLLHERKFYRLKMSLQIFAFLIPIWLMFYFLYKYLLGKESHIFAKLSFYVANAAALYGLVELIQLVYTIIPKVFLAKLIDFFTSHNMIIVLNVLGILFFLLLFGVIIHRLQKKGDKKALQKDKKPIFVKQEKCFNCATRRERDDEFCSFCGSGLKCECRSCKKKIFKYELYCRHCGDKQVLVY